MPASAMSALVDLVARARASRIWRETRNKPDRELQLQVVGAVDSDMTEIITSETQRIRLRRKGENPH